MSDTTPSAEAHEQIRLLLSTAVPFAAIVGVEIVDVGDGSATARLQPRPENLNHVATLHAGAAFTLAETASGAAMAGVFADRILEVRPVVRTATVRYRRPATRAVTASASVDGDPTTLRAQLDADKRVEMHVDVTVRHDGDDDALAVLRFDWIVSLP